MNTARERSDWKKGKTAKWIRGGGREAGEAGKEGECLGVGLGGGGGGGVGGGRSAPFPPKKRRVKRWTLYK